MGHPRDKDKGCWSAGSPLSRLSYPEESRLFSSLPSPWAPPPPRALNLAALVEQLGRELLELEELDPSLAPPWLTF